MNCYEMHWPVLDDSRTTAELIAEAVPDLLEELAGLDMRPLSAPVFSFVVAPMLHKHAGRFLVARLTVADYVRAVPA